MLASWAEWCVELTSCSTAHLNDTSLSNLVVSVFLLPEEDTKDADDKCIKAGTRTFITLF